MPDAHSPQPKPDTNYWFPDGNIILEIADTQFRIHRSLLLTHFPVFSDIFSSPKYQDSPCVDCCRMIKLEGDKAEDWECVLMAIYKPFSVYCNPIDYPISSVLSVLRLAQRYKSNDLRSMAASSLSNSVPSSLESWCHLARGVKFRLPAFRDNIFDIVTVAHEVGFNSILPGAYLLCLQYQGLENILFEGTRRKDGTLSSLSPRISKALILGWKNLTRSAMELVINVPMFNVPNGCKTRFCTPTTEGDKWLACGIKARADLQIFRTQALANNPTTAFSMDDVDCDLCEICAPPVQERIDAGRRELWNRLPAFFGLPAWSEMRDFEV